jgi:signal transduction histidine kinase
MKKEQKVLKDTFEKQLLQSKLEIQEQTLNFISQEIHDNVGQILSFAKVQINILNQKEQVEKSELAEIKESISKALVELRDLAKGLSTDRISSFDLYQGIAEEINRINRTGGVIAHLKLSENCPVVRDQVKLILFRLVQESLQNTLKHAQASEINIVVLCQSNLLCIEMHDNGVGFQAGAEKEQSQGLGLKNMMQRAELLGGTAAIRTSPGAGTSVYIKVPYA